MRKCLRCGAEMREGLELLAGNSGVGGIAKGLMGTLRKDIVVTVKAAACPECGEVSFYLEAAENLRDSTKYVML
ncbi:MAG: nucleic acid-binding protein [Anaerotignum sp.]|nr:nucleic acid-binding protein [Anaerotignum sp.]